MSNLKTRRNGLFVATSAAVISTLVSAAGAAGTGPTSYQMMGVVRDFSPSHPDFVSTATNGLGYSAGNVASTLSTTGVPVYVGGGKIITTVSRDSMGRAIAPSMAVAGPVTSFNISSNGTVSSSQPMAAKFTVIGAAITSGSYNAGVTMQIHTGASIVMPFGSFSGAVTGNINDGNNPRNFVIPNVIAPNTNITIDAQSWTRKNASSSSPNNSDWSSYMTVNSASGGVQVKALRNGDSVPSVAGFAGQVSAKGMLTSYINTSTNKMKLATNQVIYLFELGATDTDSSAFDMQDLVVLVDLATDPSYFSAAAPASTCAAVADVPAIRGAADAGGASSAASFGMWFEDRAGYNLSKAQPITMTKDGSGVYVFTTTDFRPIDGQLYGTGNSSPNRGLSFTLNATFPYSGCSGQFFEVIDDSDTWVFVNGKLVVDMGGVHAGGRQYVDMDRLGLVNGQTVRLQLFTAQRSAGASAMTIKTNIVMATHSVEMPSIANPHD